MSDLSDDRCIASYEDELEKMITTNLQQQEDFARQKLFLAFQNAAKQVTKMFRANHPAQMNWNSFHAAAEAVTVLYKGTELNVCPSFLCICPFCRESRWIERGDAIGHGHWRTSKNERNAQLDTPKTTSTCFHD